MSRKPGKPKGAVHKRTLEWRMFGKKVMDYGLPRALAILKRSKDAEFMQYFLQFLQYFQSKAKQDIDLNVVHPDIKAILDMPDDELDRYIEQVEKLKQRENGKAED